jgi:hypothetical protein
MKNRGIRRWRMATALALGAVIGVMLVAPPAGAHFLPSISHIWFHIKHKGDHRWAKIASPSFSRASESTAILDNTVGSSAGFATDTLVGQVTIKVGGTKKQLVQLQASVNVAYNSGTAPFNFNYYLSEGDNTVSANDSQVFAMHIADTADWEAGPISWVRTASPGTHTYKLYAWSASGTTPSTLVSGFSLIATTHPFNANGAVPARQIVSPRTAVRH